MLIACGAQNSRHEKVDAKLYFFDASAPTCKIIEPDASIGIGMGETEFRTVLPAGTCVITDKCIYDGYIRERCSHGLSLNQLPVLWECACVENNWSCAITKRTLALPDCPVVTEAGID